MVRKNQFNTANERSNGKFRANTKEELRISEDRRQIIFGLVIYFWMTFQSLAQLEALVSSSDPNGVAMGNVTAGQTYTCTASGCALFYPTPDADYYSDADGYTYIGGCDGPITGEPGPEPYNPYPDALSVSLIGVVDGQWVQLGENVTFTAPATGALTVLYNDSNYTDNSGNFNVTITGPPPSISVQPNSLNILQGSNAIFHIEAAGTQPIGYQWQFDGTNLTDNGHISGSQTETMTIYNVSANDAGFYQAIVTNAFGAASSAPVTLTVLGMEDVIPAGEYNALVDFYNSTLGSSWLRNQNWLSPHSFPWYGITVGEIPFDPVGNVLGTGHVTNLELSANNLDGTFPGSFVFLTQLASLDLSSNMLSGAIPTGLSGTGPTLQYLDFSYNSLSGSIPYDLGNLPVVQFFHLNHNQLNGTIPSSIGGLSQVLDLDLSDNSLTGSIPAELASCTVLSSLDLSDNNLSGTIPPQITKLVQLQYLDLSLNNLSNSIPPGFGGGLALQHLDFSYNNLSGSIPLGLGNLIYLQYLDLSDNVLTGSIPSFSGDYVLQNLNLSDNVLAGSIRPDLATLQLLTNLDLSGNSLTGSIPDFSSIAPPPPPAGPGSLQTLDIQYDNLAVDTSSLAGTVNLSAISNMVAHGEQVFYLPQNSPFIDAQPQSETVVAGMPDPLTVMVQGAPTLNYQWQFNGTNLTDNGRITGSQSPSLSINPVALSDQGQYQVSITNLYGSTNSAPATLLVVVPPAVTNPPASQAVLAGGNVVLTVGASGTGPLFYQWLFNGTNLTDNPQITGSQTNVLNLTSVTISNAGTYEVFVTNAYGSTSASAVLTVNQAIPTITWTNPAAITYGTALGSGQLNAAATVAGSFAYTPAIGTVLNTGTNTLSVIFTPTNIDYGMNTAMVSLVVTGASLKVTAANASRQVSAANPTFTGTITGLTNGDNITATYSTAASVGSPAGTYPITPALVDPGDRQTNYMVTLVNGTLTVTNAADYLTPYTFITLAGQAQVAGTNDGTGTAAHFNYPNGLAVDGAGNIYVADLRNATIRLVTSAGVVTTLAGAAGVTGTNDGTGSAARFNGPLGVAVDGATNLYVSDYGNDTIRKITQSGTNWVVSTLAGQPGVAGTNDGTGSNAQFSGPNELALDSATNLYVADSDNDTIRQVTPAGVVTTLAGKPGASGSANGTGGAARFNAPSGVTADGATNLYVADWGNSTIRKITPSGTNWIVTLLAGTAGASGSADGTNSVARFYTPNDIAVDGESNLYVAEYYNCTIRRVTPVGTNWVVSTLGGVADVAGTNDGTGSAARFYDPAGVVMDSEGTLYVADVKNDTIRKGYLALSIATAPASQIVASGYSPTFSVTAIGTGPLTYQWQLDETNLNGATSATFTVSNLQQVNGGSYQVVITSPYGSVTSSPPAILTIEPALAVSTFSGLPESSGFGNGVGTNALFDYPTGVALDASGNLYVADSLNNVVRFITSAGVVSVLAGTAGVSGTNDGVGTSALFDQPNSVALDSSNNIYVADTANNTIRELVPGGTNWVVSTIAGMAGVTGTNNGTGSAAQFSAPKGIAVDKGGNVYVADENNDTIRKLVRSGTNWTVSTLAGLPAVSGSANGTGSAARFNSPRDVATDNASNIYVADWDNYTVRKVTPAGVVTTLAGTAGKSGSTDGLGSVALFDKPHGVAVDRATNVYVADFYNSTIRKITPAGVVTTLAGLPGSTASVDGIGINAQLDEPCGLVCDSSGTNFYIADTGNHTIRRAVLDFGQPVIIAEPQAFNVAVGGTIALNVAASSASPAYQWFFDGTNISHAVSSSITITNMQMTNAGNYGVIASNSLGATTNPIATVTIVPLLITSQPTNVTGMLGSNAVFLVSITGLGPFGYQWQFGGIDITNGLTITTAQSDSLTVTNLAIVQAGSYSVAISNAYGSVTSAFATLSISNVAASFTANGGGIQFSNGSVVLQLTSLTGQGTIIVEVSSNLVQWIPIYTNPPAFGQIQIVDPVASNYPSRYYRVITP